MNNDIWPERDCCFYKELWLRMQLIETEDVYLLCMQLACSKLLYQDVWSGKHEVYHRTLKIFDVCVH